MAIFFSLTYVTFILFPGQMKAQAKQRTSCRRVLKPNKSQVWWLELERGDGANYFSDDSYQYLTLWEKLGRLTWIQLHVLWAGTLIAVLPLDKNMPCFQKRLSLLWSLDMILFLLWPYDMTSIFLWPFDLTQIFSVIRHDLNISMVKRPLFLWYVLRASTDRHSSCDVSYHTSS